MLNFKLNTDEKFVLEKTSVLIELVNKKYLYDIILTNKRIVLYLIDDEYDMTPMHPFQRVREIIFKDSLAEINICDIKKLEDNRVILKDNKELIFFDEEIIKCLKEVLK